MQCVRIYIIYRKEGDIMQAYDISVIRKTGVNQFSEEEAVGTVEADLLGNAKRLASEYIANWLIDRKITVRTRADWVKDVKRGGMTRETLVTENGSPLKMIFILRQQG